MWSSQPATTGTAVATFSANATLHSWNPDSDFLESLYAASEYGFVVKGSAEDNGTAITQIFDAREKAGGTSPRMM